MTDTKPRMFYFGPWDAPGHYFHHESGSSVYGDEKKSIPWRDYEVDGKLQPHSIGCNKRPYCGCGSNPEGEALLHHEDGWTALSFWDRSVDKRGACNSTYFAEGTFTFDEMVAMSKERFAHRWNKMPFKVFLHTE